MSHLVRSYSKSAGLSLTHILTSVDVKFISIVSGSLEDSGLFRPANILQIADVVRRIVFLRFLLCFSIVRRETSKMFSRLFHLFVPTTNKGDFCLRMLELFPGFSGFRTFHRTNKFERQKLITSTSKEDYPSTGRR